MPEEYGKNPEKKRACLTIIIYSNLPTLHQVATPSSPTDGDHLRIPHTSPGNL
jgi:hypothetical protein